MVAAPVTAPALAIHALAFTHGLRHDGKGFEGPNLIPEHLVAGRLLSLQADTVTAPPDNPPLTDRPSAR